MSKREARQDAAQARSKKARPKGEAFRADQRLRTPDDFARVYQHRCSVSDMTLIVYGARNEHGRSRLGMSVSRKVGNAVTRNRWKRLIREAFRLGYPKLPVGLDIIVLPRRGSQPIWGNVQRSLTELVPLVHRKLATRKNRKGPP